MINKRSQPRQEDADKDREESETGRHMFRKKQANGTGGKGRGAKKNAKLTTLKSNLLSFELDE